MLPHVSRQLTVSCLDFAVKQIGDLNTSSLSAARQPLLVGSTTNGGGVLFTVRAFHVCHIRRARCLTVKPTVRLTCCTPLKLDSRVSGIWLGRRLPRTYGLLRRSASPCLVTTPSSGSPFSDIPQHFGPQLHQQLALTITIYRQSNTSCAFKPAHWHSHHSTQDEAARIPPPSSPCLHLPPSPVTWAALQRKAA
jgi:hypothetical protein